MSQRTSPPKESSASLPLTSPDLEKIFRANPIAISIARLSDFRFIEANDGFVELTKYSRKELLGHSPEELGMVVNELSYKKLFTELRRRRSIKQRGMLLRIKGGTILHVLASYELITLQGEQCIVCAKQDVTNEMALQQSILLAAEEAQARLGQELHDGLCQELAAGTFMVELLLKSMSKRPADADLIENMQNISQVVKKATTETQGLASGLFPTSLSSKDITHALSELARNVSARSQVSCLFDCEKNFNAKDKIAGIHMYRIVQEAVRNAIQHGKATHIVIDMTSHADEYVITISDDGVGMPERVKKDGMGIGAMEYRSRLLNGSLNIRSRRPQGTIVTLTCPGTSH